MMKNVLTTVVQYHRRIYTLVSCFNSNCEINATDLSHKFHVFTLLHAGY